MKKFGIIAVVLVLTLTMAGCRGNKQDATSDTTNTTTASTSTTATTPSTNATRPSTNMTEPSMDMTLPDMTDGTVGSGSGDHGTVGNGTAGDDNGILPGDTNGRSIRSAQRPY